MLKLSRMTDYAVVVMSQMADRPNSRLTASELAQSTGLPGTTVSQVLKPLTRSGLIESHRGSRGGYALNRVAENISVADIVAALDGPVALTACVEGAVTTCGVESLCPMRGGWEKVNTAIRAALESVSLADMTGSSPGYGGLVDDERRRDAALHLR